MHDFVAPSSGRLSRGRPAHAVRAAPSRTAGETAALQLRKGTNLAGYNVPLYSTHRCGGAMQRLAWMWILTFFLLFSLPVRAQSSPSSQGTWRAGDTNDRLFLPRDMRWGWARFDLARPYNEIDANL